MVPWTTLYPLRRRELDLGGLRVTVDEIDGRFSGLRERLKWETEIHNGVWIDATEDERADIVVSDYPVDSLPYFGGWSTPASPMLERLLPYEGLIWDCQYQGLDGPRYLQEDACYAENRAAPRTRFLAVRRFMEMSGAVDLDDLVEDFFVYVDEVCPLQRLPLLVPLLQTPASYATIAITNGPGGVDGMVSVVDSTSSSDISHTTIQPQIPVNAATSAASSSGVETSSGTSTHEQQAVGNGSVLGEEFASEAEAAWEVSLWEGLMAIPDSAERRDGISGADPTTGSSSRSLDVQSASRPPLVPYSLSPSPCPSAPVESPAASPDVRLTLTIHSSPTASSPEFGSPEPQKYQYASLAAVPAALSAWQETLARGANKSLVPYTPSSSSSSPEFCRRYRLQGMGREAGRGEQEGLEDAIATIVPELVTIDEGILHNVLPYHRDAFTAYVLDLRAFGLGQKADGDEGERDDRVRDILRQLKGQNDWPTGRLVWQMYAEQILAAIRDESWA